MSWYRVRLFLRDRLDSILYALAIIGLIVFSIWSVKMPYKETVISDNVATGKEDSVDVNKVQIENDKTKKNENVSVTVKDTIDATPQTKQEDQIETGKLKIHTFVSDFPVSASVFIDDEFHGMSDRRGHSKIYTLPVNEPHIVKISKSGFIDWQDQVEVDRNRLIEIIAKLSPKQDSFGTLEFQATPGVDSIIVNGKALPPGTASANFPVGVYHVRYINTTIGAEWETKVFLDLNETKQVSHTFEEKETGYLVVTLSNAREFGYGYVFIDGNIWKKDEYNTTPLKIQLPVGKHKVEVRRDGFHRSPADTTIHIEKNQTRRIAFKLIPIESSF